MKPIVDGIESQYAGRLTVLHVDVTQPSGRATAREFGFQFTPTFIFFGADGKELWRSVGSLDEDQLKRSLNP